MLTFTGVNTWAHFSLGRWNKPGTHQITPSRQEQLNKWSQASNGETLLCKPNLSRQRQGDIFAQPLPLSTIPLPPQQQITTWHPHINWKKRSKMFERSEPEMPFRGETCALQVIAVTNCHLCYEQLNIIGWDRIQKGGFQHHLHLYVLHNISRIKIKEVKKHPGHCCRILPPHWGVICYCRWLLKSTVFFLNCPKIKIKKEPRLRIMK